MALTIDDACCAKAKLLEKIGDASWLKGIGIGAGSSVKVNVDEVTDEVRAALLSEIDGVVVIIEAVGTLRAT